MSFPRARTPARCASKTMPPLPQQGSRSVSPARATRFTATAASQVLTFLAVGTPAGQPPISLLDGVNLTFVPEPGSALVVIAGLAGLATLARRLRAGRSPRA